jgi:hypothetical protein
MKKTSISTPWQRGLWEVVLESEPYGREVLRKEISATSAIASVERLILAAEKECRNAVVSA